MKRVDGRTVKRLVERSRLGATAETLLDHRNTRKEWLPDV